MKEHPLTGMVRTKLRQQAKQLERTQENSCKRYAERVNSILGGIPDQVVSELRETGDIPDLSVLETAQAAKDIFGEEG